MSTIRERINWNGPIEAAIVVAIILGATIPFFILNKSDIKESKKESLEVIKSIEAEIKDFHARLIRIEENR